MTIRWLAVGVVLTLAGADPAGAQGERHVCRLLKASEVAAYVGPAVALANVVEDEPERSTCHYEDKEGIPLFILTVYWKGGKTQWNASSAARTAGDRMLADAEGVGIDSLAKARVVKAGPVAVRRGLLQRSAAFAGAEGRHPGGARHVVAPGPRGEVPAVGGGAAQAALVDRERPRPLGGVGSEVGG